MLEMGKMTCVVLVNWSRLNDWRTTRTELFRVISHEGNIKGSVNSEWVREGGGSVRKVGVTRVTTAGFA